MQIEEAMKKNKNWLLAFALVVGSLCVAGTAAAQVTIEVMNPRGEIPPPKTLGISPRGGSLDGKKIVLIDNGKYGASNFLDVLAAMLKEKYPTATVVMYPKPAAQTITDLPKWYPTVKQQGDLFVFGVGD
jgi:predicted GTPase